MPYASNADLPQEIRDALPDHAQSIFRRVVNSALADGDKESSAFAQAWGAVKQGYEQNKEGEWVAKADPTASDVHVPGADWKEEGLAARVTKVDSNLGLVFGWAIVCKIAGEPYFDLNIDRDTGKRVPEHIPENAMLKASTDFMLNSRVGNEMHDGPDTGTYVFAWPLTEEIAKAMGIQTNQTGLMIAYKPTPEVLKKFQDGTYRGFSIEGSRVHSTEIE